MKDGGPALFRRPVALAAAVAIVAAAAVERQVPGLALGQVADVPVDLNNAAPRLLKELKAMQTSSAGLAKRVVAMRGRMQRLGKTVATLALNLTQAEQASARMGLATAANARRLAQLADEERYLLGRIAGLNASAAAVDAEARNATAAAASVGNVSALLGRVEAVRKTVEDYSPGGSVAERIDGDEAALANLSQRAADEANRTVFKLFPRLAREQRAAFWNLSNITTGASTANWSDSTMAYYRFTTPAPAEVAPAPVRLRRRPCSWTALWRCED